jgi:peptide/nickel transport system permease protein
MLGFLQQLWRSRGTRKFVRNRLALVATAVIALYALTGAYLVASDLLGGRAGLSLDEVEQPVGPSLNVPGILETPRAELRVEVCRFHMDEFKRALRPRSPEAREDNVRAIRSGMLRAADAPTDELAARLKAAEAIYADLSASPNLDADPALAPKITELEAAVARLYQTPTGWAGVVQSAALSMGTDRQGRSILLRGLYSIKVALVVGLVVASVSVVVGTLLGAAAAYFGGWVDKVVVWLYSTLSSVPELILLAVIVYAFNETMFDKASNPWLALVPVFAAMCMEFWIGPCRVVRGEVLKIKELEYVQAVRAVGFGRAYILLRHVIPNTVHLMFINFSLLFIAAIKFEVILSFLGLGVKKGPSWGRMIHESTHEVINGFFWQIGVATVLLFALVLAFNIVSDALQDAFDPKHVG